MNIGNFNLNQLVLIVAEIGNNHEGNADRARELIDRAAEAGVDAVKLQVIQAATLVSARDTKRLAQLKSFELSLDVHVELCERAARHGLLTIATPFDFESLEFIADEVDALKIASGDVTCMPLIEAAAAHPKPLIVSTGSATLGEIERAVETIRLVRSDWPYVMDSLALLHCVSAYPAPADQLNLRAIGTLRTHFGCTTGYSDHALGIDAAALAVACGARIIEKHFTLDKSHSSFRDHQLSADPVEMRGLVTRVREVEAMLGDGLKEPMPCEETGRAAMRRSAYARRRIERGATVSDEDIIWMRPEHGVPASDAHRLIGAVARATIEISNAIEGHMIGALSTAAAGASSDAPGAR
jgi:N,N'-diacetyllegionaminate synthase